MTEDELRALDADVAERVMGWYRSTRHYSGFDRVILKPPAEPAKRNGYGFRYSVQIGDLWCATEMPRYSSDIAAAWQVVEHTNLLKHYFLHQDNQGRWCLSDLWDQYGGDEMYLGQDLSPLVVADTAPETICRAALKAAAKGTDNG